jgi:hypothetical protein
MRVTWTRQFDGPIFFVAFARAPVGMSRAFPSRPGMPTAMDDTPGPTLLASVPDEGESGAAEKVSPSSGPELVEGVL